MRFFGERTLAAVLLLCVGLLSLVGCQKGSSVDQPTASSSDRPAPAPQKSTDPQAVLNKLVETYRHANSYEDAGELLISVEAPGGQKDDSPPIPFSVTFERPNKLRIHALDANVVSDGRTLRASINSLADQILYISAPDKITPEMLMSDSMLVAAMRGQLDIGMPQIALLLASNPVNMLVGEATPTLLEDASYGGEMCQRVSFKSPDGNTVLWISPTTNLLVKFEFPSDGFKQKFSLAKCSIWAEMKGARVNRSILGDAFRMQIPDTAKLLKRFMMPPPVPPPSILAKPAGNFKLLDFRTGGEVTTESLKGKVAVLDMWATWCGWCFKGFPNLQAVYNKYDGNNKVAILAVNKDDPNITDEQVKKSFADNSISIPIVRDQSQSIDKVIDVPGLPTMVILGMDGTVQDFHVGFDANLQETLPAKIDRLLAGENIAQDDVAKYEAARAEYEKALAEVLVDRSAATP